MPVSTPLLNGLGGTAGFGENTLARSDDGSSGFIDITSVFPTGLNFYGTSYTGFYINNNGNITFSSAVADFTPTAITGNTGQAIVAPFFADVDTRAGVLTTSPGGTSTGSNSVYWDLSPGDKQVVVTWDDVGAYANGTTPNAFQLILKQVGTGARNFSIEFRYEDIQWLVGAASGTTLVRAGYSAGDGVNFYEIAESGFATMANLESASNHDVPGDYLFTFINGDPIYYSSATTTLPDEFTNLTLTGTGNISGTGNALDNSIVGNSGNNILTGLAGNDTLNGAAGADTMLGGTGNDTYIVDNAGDVVTENLNEGTDTVLASISYTLGANVENLTLTGTAISGTGNALDNIMIGNGSNNILSGGAGNDTLNGGAGADTMSGGTGNDTYIVDNASDVVTENLSEGTDTVLASVDYTLGANVENLTLTGTAISGTGNTLDNIIIGNGSNNILSSGAGNDTLDGGAGVDTMSGGADNDTYIVDNAGDVVTENLNEGTDTVLASVDYTLGANVENLTLTGTAISGTGNALANTIVGNSGDNILDGGADADTLTGGAGNDTYVVDNAGDVVTENLNEGTDTVIASIDYALGANVENLTLTGTAISGTGNTLDNTIIGNSSNNILSSGAGNDTLDGGAGADSMTGGTDNDTYVVDSTGDVVTENLNEGTDTVIASIDYTLGANLENLTLTGTAISGTGNALANNINGNAGNNTIDGGTGADTMSGGAGNDTYIVDNTGDVVTENFNEGIDTVIASVDYTLSANVENLILTGTGNISGTGDNFDNILVGNSGNNTLIAGSGNDTLDGGAGADTLNGGTGNDTYIVDNIGDVVIENLNEGTDTVLASIDYTLTANVENLTLTGTGNINGTGNGLANTLVGNAGNNIIDGGAGADTMSGGAGNDTYIVDTAGDVVTENLNEGTDTVIAAIDYALGANVENLTLTGTAISGTGNGLANAIVGNAGNNTIDGGAGADTMSGGAGNDTYVVDNAGDVVTENLNEGTDTVLASIDYTLTVNVENLTLTGTGNINGTGNGLANAIVGNRGNNFLDGGAGADTLSGGAGNDTYIVDNAGDIVTENLNEGTDTVIAAIDYTLGANLENLTLTGTAISGTGNGLANTIVGNAGNNFLDGGAGADTLVGGAGNDTYIVDNAGDVVTENLNEGTDTVIAAIDYTLTANVENLTLTGTGNINGTGNGLANAIVGNSGNNFLDGGAGADTLAGGAGNDTYVVDNAGDVVTENLNEGTDTVIAAIDYTLGANIENLTLTGTAISGTGNGLANTIVGNAGNNIIDGGAGADTMSGGNGNDTYYVDNAGDVVTENLNEGTDTVIAAIDYTLGANVENLTLTGTAISATGNGLANTIVGNAGNNTIDGGAGADTMSGGTGNDTYIVDNTGDVIVENLNEGIDTVIASSDYTLGANIENLTLTGTGNISGTGNGLANTIVGTAGNNTIDGGADADTMSGGAGNDTYVVDNLGDVVTENFNEGIDTVVSSISYVLGANVENLTLTGTGNINGTGNALDNTIVGNSGDNSISGEAGNDTLIGVDGNDNIQGGDGNDTLIGAAGDDNLQGNSGEDLLLGGDGSDNLQGGDGNDTLIGGSGDDNLKAGAGDDLLDGTGGGLDVLFGGTGNDTYLIDSTDASTIESFNQGIDTVAASVTYEIGANIENLTLTGIANINGTGNSLDNVITGNSGDNFIDGGAGSDTLIGGGGNDTLLGGSGNDTFVVDSTNAIVTENLNEGIDTVQSSVTYTIGANIENLTLTGTAISGTGNALANTIVGNAGNNIIDGGAGADTMSGGAGNDTYLVDNAGDVVTENLNEGTDTVIAAIDYTLGANVENLTLTGTAISGTGNGLANTIVGNAGNNILDGGAGADTLIGGTGNDTYLVDNIGDVVTENLNEGTDTVIASIDYTLSANVENLTLTGTAISATGNGLANTIVGNSGNNTIDGGADADTMSGGAGNDTYLVDTAGDVIIENLNEGTDTVIASIDYTLGVNVENLTLTGTAISGAGNALANTIVGNSGDNRLDGGAGADTLIGGTGNDTYLVDNISDVITENLNEGTDTVIASIDYTLSANVENLTLTGTAIAGTGNGLANTIVGNTGNNLLDGGAGADTLIGGTGNDTYVVDNIGDVVTENLTEGTDTVQASIAYILGANVENLTLTGTANINGVGNALDNLIIGNSGDNSISGEAGNDTLLGGDGNDNIQGGDGNDILQGNSGDDNLQGNVGDDFLDGGIGSDNLQGGDGNDTMIGGAGDDNLKGGAGDDLLDGTGGGLDVLSGGTGNDTYLVDSTDATIIETLNQGIDTVQTSVNYTIGANVENLTLTGTANINGTGNSLANVITGNSGDNLITAGAGNDTLIGGGGNDTLIGGTGNDTYIVDNTSSIITEALSQGTDTVQSAVTYTLGTNLENLTLAGLGNIDGTGNSLNNLITGNSGDNHLNAGAGNDTIDGGAGNDYIEAGTGSDIIDGGAGIDYLYINNAGDANTTIQYTTPTSGTIIGGANNGTIFQNIESVEFYTGAGNDTIDLAMSTNAVYVDAGAGNDTIVGSLTASSQDLHGGDGNDNLTGGNNNDTLFGDAGNDTLTGGTGADTMTGGTGNDIYIVDNANDVVSENLNEGIDTIQTSVSYALVANVENLIFTGTGNINATGNSLANAIVGNAGNNILDGGAGADTLTGGNGDDTYYVDNSGDIVTENLNEGNDTVIAAVDYTLGANVENLTLTGTANLNGTGNALANAIVGNAGNNILNGGAGTDTMTGGNGDDTYYVDGTGDVVTENSNEGNDTVIAAIDYTLGANVENLTLTGTAIRATGNELNNLIIGDAIDNILDGGAGNDTLNGGAGADTLIGGTGNDTYVIDNINDVIVENLNAGTDSVLSSITYSLSPNLENLTLTGTDDINGNGNSLDNLLCGNSGDNIISGGGGADTICGGSGNDHLIGEAGDDYITGDEGNDYLSGGAGNDILLGNTGDDYLSGGTGDDRLIAGDGDDNLTGGAGNDTLDGTGSGLKTLVGGTGNDTYIVTNTADTITEHFTEGIDLVWSSVDYTLSANVENMNLVGTVNGIGNSLDNTIVGVGAGDNIIDGGAGNDYIDGGAGNDALYGGDGNDIIRSGDGNNILDGGAGNDVLFSSTTGVDTLTGGSGDDVYEIRNSNDIISENANGGTDTVWTDVNYTLSANVENMYLVGSIYGTGNASDNTIVGYGAGEHAIDGGAGNDILEGNISNDTLVGGAGNDALYGRDGNDLLFGGDGNNTLDGGAGNDVLFSSATGVDTLTGGSGDDVYEIHNSNDAIVENANGGTDTVWTDVSYTLSANVEQMYLVGSINGTGNDSDNTIVGYGAGEHVIDGAAGNDLLVGGTSNDTLLGGAGNDALYGGDGNDILRSGDGNNTLDGGAGNDTLFSSATGVDTLTGGSGDDVYEVRNSNDIITENPGGGADSVWTDVNYTLAIDVETLILVGSINGTGNAGDNTIIGYGAGDNTINGGAGNDTLVGGAGNDSFVFSGNPLQSLLNSIGIDTIADFTVGQDTMLLSKTIFGLSASVGGTLVSPSDFGTATTDLAAETLGSAIVYNSANGKLFYDANGSAAGFGAGGQFAQITSGLSLTGNDFKAIG
jgi:trimeric autotransporter adhesin